MEIIICLIIGYLLGSLNPAALLAKLKHTNLREQGTRNLGASNATIVLGKKYGALVMVFDILKAFLAAKAAKWLFPKLVVSGLLAGLGAVIGHIFPFYMNFKGGKGLAAFGGLALACSPWMFVFLLTLGVVLMLVVNYSYVMPMSVAVLLPILVLIQTQRLDAFLICAAAGLLIIVKHWSNIGKAKRGEDIPIRDFVKNKLLTKSK